MQQIVTLLKKHQQRESIGALIEAMETGEQPTTDLARVAVIAILPQLTAADAPLLKERHRACLYRALRGSNTELIVAILLALEQLGDPKAIPTVKRLTSCPIWIWDSDIIEQAAQQCLAALQEREAKQQTRQTLLRAITGSVPHAHALLRPSQERSR